MGCVWPGLHLWMGWNHKTWCQLMVRDYRERHSKRWCLSLFLKTGRDSMARSRDGSIPWRLDPVTARLHHVTITWRLDHVRARSRDGSITWGLDHVRARSRDGSITWRLDHVTARSRDGSLMGRLDHSNAHKIICWILNILEYTKVA